ncbi:hypothetical protein SAMN04488548_1342333 [Gordonia westfalica]|uniref:Uncharacterized protein n=1 Tax=Gordonia westfalica TaxID=158898 RepID=A0A1H2JPS3_9ACTN|nr:hypothetical protein SAMN04488548_1342333 [Gordonia westfalica]
MRGVDRRLVEADPYGTSDHRYSGYLCSGYLCSGYLYSGYLYLGLLNTGISMLIGIRSSDM